jgi:DNA mismatch repair ATPase MutS
MQNTSPAVSYANQSQTQKTILRSLQRKRSRLGWTRFTVFILTAILAYYLFSEVGAAGFYAIAAGLVALIALVFSDADNNRRLAHIQALIRINEEELQVLQHQYSNLYDGADYADSTHAYAADLDLFGPFSLFQYLNRCYTAQGRKQLSNNLLHPLHSSEIRERQEAVKELAPALAWRQDLQATAASTPLTHSTQQKIEVWLADEETHYGSPFWKVFVTLYSLITTSSVIAALLDLIPTTLFFSLFTLYYIVGLFLSRNATKAYTQLSGIVKEVAVLESLVAQVNRGNFGAPLLKKLQADASGATGATQQLKATLDRFDMRLNVFAFIIINSFFLWDVRQIMALNDWRAKNKKGVQTWFNLVSEAEVLNSLATLHFNQPLWSFPAFSKLHFTLQGTHIGHPLLAETQRVTSNFEMHGAPKIGLITGSNMAGKSTFLRSLGVNIVLAQSGAPVCANRFELSPVYLLSSMRIADNLAENTSTFYAELKKLKTIIEAVNRHETVFILLDEILRGTNSLDRHTGSKALIHQLVKEGAVAVIATHDVELAALQANHPSAIENYHFDVQVEGEELYFDYKLKTGVCTSLNASILMKKIGIQLS